MRNVVLLLLLAAAHPIAAATVDVKPAADTYLETYGSEDRNFGREPVLRIDQWGGRQALLRFDARPLRDRRIARAALRLHITEVGHNEQGEFPGLNTCVALYDVVTPWTEEGATHRTFDGRAAWRRGPGIGGQGYHDVGPLPAPDIGVRLRRDLVAFPAARVAPGRWLELDVTEWLRGRARAGDASASLVVRASTLGRNVTFASREAADPSLRPHLRVQTGPGADFTVAAPFVTDWRPGRAIALAVRSRGKSLPPGPWRWTLAARPGASAAPASRLLKARGAAATLTPDVPGLFRVTVQGPGMGTETAEVVVLRVAAHPRLYVDPTRLAALRQQVRRGDRLPAALLAWVDAGASGAAQGRFHDMGLPDGCENSALAYLLTRQERHATNAALYGDAIVAKPMRSHFGDVHDATYTGAAWVHAVACWYDWCHDRLSPARRQAVRAWLVEAARWSAVRAGRPMAHNDGGGRQVLLAAPPLALLGDDAAAPDLWRAARANFEGALLPWLNDGGRGGRSGDGGEYEGLHAFFIVRYAWMARSATGEDVFSDSPFFRNRLRHVLFGWYPRPLVERSGAYSMRTYYSPAGDHIRLGYVGDTQPYQSAAALCDRYRSTPEARAVRRLAGAWPTQWMQYTLRWAVLGDFDSVPGADLPDLAYLDAGHATLYARQDWTDDATWVLLEGGPYVSAHGSLYAGGFEVFKGDLLAARTGNLDHANVGAKHAMEYLHRTIATNGLLIDDPQEKWRGFLGGAAGGHDGGGQRTNFPLGSSPGVDEWLAFREVFDRGSVTRHRLTRDLAYACADITPAYNSPTFHGGALNRPKVSSVTRQLLYLRGLDTVVVHDRVSSLDPAYRKTWLLHSLGELDVLDGTRETVDEGETRHTGATRAVIRHGWPKPVASHGRCLSVTLLPVGARLTRIGGRVDLPPGQVSGWPGDQWHGEHRHRHIKDFWVNGANVPPGNPPETRWFGEPTSPWYVPGTPDESGGRGKWRLEVSPPAPARDDVFLHVLCPRLGQEGPFPQVARLPAGAFEGALVQEGGRAAAAFFARAERRERAFTADLPPGAAWDLLVTDLEPGRYRVQAGGAGRTATVGADGVLELRGVRGRVTLSP